MDLKRPHFTCLTCWVRRWYYKKMSGLKKIDKLKLDFSMVQNRRGIMVLPEKCKAYLLFINEDSKYPKVRNMLLKPLLTLAETIARW